MHKIQQQTLFSLFVSNKTKYNKSTIKLENKSTKSPCCTCVNSLPRCLSGHLIRFWFDFLCLVWILRTNGHYRCSILSWTKTIDWVGVGITLDLANDVFSLELMLKCVQAASRCQIFQQEIKNYSEVFAKNNDCSFF